MVIHTGGPRYRQRPGSAFFWSKYYVTKSGLTVLLCVQLLFSQCVWAAEASPAPPSTETTAAPEAAAVPNTVDGLLKALTSASLSEIVDMLPRMAELGGRDILPVFEAMAAGELYYEPATLKLIRITEKGDTKTARAVLSGDVLTGIDDSTLEKVRINNRLRGMLRENIARIMLTQGSASERESAAVALFDNLDDSSAALLTQALTTEKDAKVRAVLAVGIAMQAVLTATDDMTRITALKTLDGRLEAPVRNLLTRLTDDSTTSADVKAAAQTTLAGIEAKIQLYKIIEQLFFGLSLGSVLLLAATGLAVTFGVMGVINMAHGEMLMLGAYTTYVVQLLMPNAINQSLWVAIPAAFLVTALFGILIQRFVIRYLNGRPLETLLATFGISLILQQAVRTVFSPLNRLVSSPDWMSGSLQINPALSLTNNRIFILLFSLLVFVILQLVLKKTSLGLHVRAVSQNRAMAKAMGIRTDIVDALTFGLGSGIAGIAGVALSQLTNVGPNLGQSYIIDSFMVVVFGGVGNLLGTLLAAFSLGMANKFLEPLTGAVLANILILVFIILFIQKRPKGLFPQKGRAAD